MYDKMEFLENSTKTIISVTNSPLSRPESYYNENIPINKDKDNRIEIPGFKDYFYDMNEDAIYSAKKRKNFGMEDWETKIYVKDKTDQEYVNILREDDHKRIRHYLSDIREDVYKAVNNYNSLNPSNRIIKPGIIFNRDI